MRTATGPETIRKAFELSLVYLMEDRHHSLLDDLVLQSCDAQRALASIRRRDLARLIPTVVPDALPGAPGYADALDILRVCCPGGCQFAPSADAEADRGDGIWNQPAFLVEHVHVT